MIDEDVRGMFLGLDEEVDYSGGTKAAVNLDSAATTPPLIRVIDEINRLMPMYGSIGRGTGQKSQSSSKVYTDGRDEVLAFVGADSEKYTVIYTNCTPDGMNKLASALIGSPRDRVLTTRMEHHANDLPWRERARTVYVDVDEKGRLKLDDYERILEKYNYEVELESGEKVRRNEIKYVAVTAASNVTGYVNDVHKIAGIAHRYGAQIIVDGAQIVAHRAFSMRSNEDCNADCSEDRDIDFFVFSAHKMYSPYGGGAIVGLKDVLNARLPVFYGGGIVEKVTDDDVVYSPEPDRYEAGSPNYAGVVGMLEAMRFLREFGFKRIKEHEQELLRYALDRLEALNGEYMGQVLLYGDSADIGDRVGILTFNLKMQENKAVAEYLSWHAAIAVRHAKFCAHTYVDRLLGHRESDKSDTACVTHEGMVRVSFGLYTVKEDIDALIDAVRDMLEGKDAKPFADAYIAATTPERAVRLPNDRG
ncbi:MAG: aminotransferase class V-fold PLP-dependent enzyme [Clostridiales bacterium]|jgi:selenocysteine lyase/cysteine desulfurase|nr:aminotransferase class V-fold PLP-dependent enzyme [Clostridiales bacterium]